MPDKQINKLNNNSATLIFFVNGKKVIDKNPDPECTLLTYLRDKLLLCGTKLGCGEGGCGACTVMVSKVNRKTEQVKHLAVNACLTPVCAMHGCAVITIEGIGSTRTRLHPVQERIAKAHGSQCGFCTPGIVMSMYALLRNSPQPTMKDLEIAFQGNLCRCTGYRPIIEGYKTFTKEFGCGMGEKCCKLSKNSIPDNMHDKLFEKSEFLPYDATQEPIFPPELLISDVLDNEYLKFKSPRVTWYRPTTINELLFLKGKYPDAKIVVGNTEIGVEVKFKHFLYPILINTGQIEELNEISENENGIFFGASVTLMDIENVLRNQIQFLPEHEVRLYECILDMMPYFAGKQIRNVASLGGNIMTGSPISDMNPILTAAGIELVVGSAKCGNSLRSVNMGKGFFTGYRQNVIKPNEVLIGIKIPRTKENQFIVAYKQAKRRDDDIAIVNGAFNIIFTPDSNVVENICMAFGGMAPTTVLAQDTCKLIIGKEWRENLIEIVTESLCKELPLSANAPGGMISYRRSLVTSLFFKAFLAVSELLEKEKLCDSNIPNIEKSGSNVFHTLIPKSAQLFEKPSENQSSIDPIGRPKIHSSAFKQATGEAVYCDDMPKIENELYLALVMSTKAHATITAINPSEALQLEGVHAFYSSKDLSPDENQVGAVVHDEEIFASNKVTCYGQVIGAIVAENQALAQRAARMVKVVYADVAPIIVSIEDAIKYESYYPGFPKTLENGNIEEAFKNSDHIIEGSCRMGGQEHFYLETHAAYAVPKDNGDELEIFCSTQHPSEVQKLIAHSLSIPAAKVVCRVKRLGGGFGGKESRATILALPVAFAAYKLRRPIRCMLDRDEDMILTGTRHPFYSKYKVACAKNGKINGCEIDIYCNAGCSSDLSYSVLDRAIFHYQNSYKIPNVKATGWLCKTNLPSNTAFRGFGGPQGMFAGEHIIRDVAKVCRMDYADVMYKNLYHAGDATHFSQIIESDTITRCWNDCIKQSKFYEQRKEVETFNKKNKWRKRGVAICPTMYGISFTALHLNQGGAFINIYEDGSVLLTHGGTEMGQGLHIKMIQVAAKTLQISQEKIYISETSTDKVPNTSPTAASSGSDLNGMAVLEACQKLNERLKSIKEEYPTEKWETWIKKAYFNRISLSATGFYKTPNIGYNPQKNTGNPFSYYTNGVAVSLVEIDCLTGDHQVLKTDIVMDIGSSLNPAIDIGQIEGAFMQGYGLFTMEEMIYSSNGIIYSRGPGMYKLPGFSDIPGELNVTILTGAPNPHAVYSSKAVGEPPLFLAATVFFAIKEAIAAARIEQKQSIDFDLISPATSARIRMACEDQFTKLVKEEPNNKNIVPWNVMP